MLPERTPPSQASSISTRPDSGLSLPRQAISAMIFRFIVQAVSCLTPSRRPSFTDEIPFFTVAIRWMAGNHIVNGSLVEWKTVLAVGEVCFLRGLH